MASEGLGIAVIRPRSWKVNLRGQLELLSTDLEIPPLMFSASWLVSSHASGRTGRRAARIANEVSLVDPPRRARH
jgi:hypothetical protein